MHYLTITNIKYLKERGTENFQNSEEVYDQSKNSLN